MRRTQVIFKTKKGRVTFLGRKKTKKNVDYWLGYHDGEIDAEKKLLEKIENKFSVKQFGEEMVDLARKFPDQIRFIIITEKDWNNLKKRQRGERINVDSNK